LSALAAPGLPPEALRLLQSATRMETPCGEGSIVWHVWGEGEPLVMLHGGSGSWTHWLRNIEALAGAGRRLYIPDLPGFGDSGKPSGGNDADAIVEPLAKGMLQLVGAAACDILGFSFGGMVAGFLAAKLPLRVKRLVLLGAPGLGLGDGKRLPLKAWRHLPTQAERDAVHHSNLATLMLLHEASVDGLAIAIQANNVVRDRMTGRRLALTDALLQALVQVNCPIHAIYGEQDALYRTRMDALAAVLHSVPRLQSLSWIPDAGHWVQYERPEAFDSTLLRLLPL